MMNYTYDAYDAYGRRTGMNLTDGTVRAQAGYTYDTAGRVATVGDGGDTLTYAYAPGTSRIASAAWTTATGNNSAYTYDNYHRLTGIAVNNTPVYGYTLNDKDQRTGATLENGDNWAYTYDTLGQLTGALKKDSQDNMLNNMSYAFDLIGNRTSAVEDATNWTYASNLLNQYTQVNALLPTYDADGNMLTWNGWTYTWNGENRLASATNGNTRLEFDYDFLGRRIFKKVYTNNTLTEHRKFAYNGYKLIAEFDAMNSNALLANYLWQPVGLDVPLRATIDGDACYFVADGNKNIIALKDTTGATTDDYTYTPFGAVTASGSTDNPIRFSSEYYDAETGLVYYNYRYYCPTLGRWTKRDPLEEKGGINLYLIVDNKPISNIDVLGTLIFPSPTPPIPKPSDFKSFFKDDEGYQIFERWASGKGNWPDAPFGEYLKKHKGLNYAMREYMSGEFLKLADKPIGFIHKVSDRKWQTLQNDYVTGYGLLHISNASVGNFRIKGEIIKKGAKCYHGNINYTWNDIIDPNYDYRLDMVDIPFRFAFAARPRDYTIIIKFSGTFEAIQTDETHGYYVFSGYPKDSALIDLENEKNEKKR